MSTTPDNQSATDATVQTPPPATEAAPALLDTVEKVFDEWARLREQPATEEQMAQIWPLWNALPAGMIPEKKSWILAGTFLDTHAEHRECLKELSQRFPDANLPLDRNAYHQALAKAALWSGLVHYLSTTIELHQTAVEAQLDYSTFDDVLTGRVAIYRTARELMHTRPGIFAKITPTLTDIEHLRQRYAVYLQARQDAIDLLHPLVFLKQLRSRRELPLSERAFGIPHPPEDFPQHVYIARLAAFGKCSSKRLADFFTTGFLQLSRAQMDEFADEFHRPTDRRRGKYLFFAVWLADNAPLFNAFKMTWAAILDLAREHFNTRAPDGYRDCPDNPDNLKMFWKDHEDRLWRGQPRRIMPPSGRPRANAKRSLPVHLLTPLPFVITPPKG